MSQIIPTVPLYKEIPTTVISQNEILMHSGIRAEGSPSRSLWIGNIHPETTIDEICSIANIHGPIQLVKINGSKACAFVNFVHQSSADSMYKQGNETPFTLHGRKVPIRWGKSDPLTPELQEAINQGATRNLFVYNIAPSVTEEDLRKLFGKYGNFQSISIQRNKGFAFVNLSSLRGAIHARNDKNRIELAGRQIQINFAKEGVAPKRKAAEPIILRQPICRAVYLGGVPDNATYHDICKLANQFGGLESVRIVREKKCAFVNFLELGPSRAFFNAGNHEIRGHRVRVGWGKCGPVPRELLELTSRGATRNLYVANLPPDCTKEELERAFSSHGEFEGIRLMNGKNIAFVNYTSIKSAVEALNTLQAYEIRGCTLKIAYAKEGVSPNAASLVAQLTAPPLTHDAFGRTIQPVSRAIYVGNIAPGTTYRDLCGIANRFGRLEAVHLIEEKKSAFLNFIDAASSQAMHTYAQQFPFQLRGQTLKIGWGKVGRIKKELMDAIQKGATRNLFVGNVDESVVANDLRQLFSVHGIVEYVSILRAKNTAFVNMTSVASAIQAWASLNGHVLNGKPIKVAYAREGPK